MAQCSLGVKLDHQAPPLIAIVVFAGNHSRRAAGGKNPGKFWAIAEALDDVVRFRHIALAQNYVEILKLSQRQVSVGLDRQQRALVWNRLNALRAEERHDLDQLGA